MAAGEADATLLAAAGLDRLGRPDDYQRSLPERYRRIDAAALNQAAATWLQPEGLVFGVVGDRKVVEPQLKDLGLPIEVATPVDTGPAKSE